MKNRNSNRSRLVLGPTLLSVPGLSWQVGKEYVLFVRHIQESGPLALPTNVIVGPTVRCDGLGEDLGFLDVESDVDPAHEET